MDMEVVEYNMGYRYHCTHCGYDFDVQTNGEVAFCPCCGIPESEGIIDYDTTEQDSDNRQD